MTTTYEPGTDARSLVTDSPDKQSSIEPKAELHMTTQDTTNISTELVPASSTGVSYSADGGAIGLEDIAVPRLYVGQPTARAVQAELVPRGALYVASDADDPEPRIIHKLGEKGAVIHVIAMGRAWTYTDDEGRFQVTGDRATDRQPGASRAYQFLVVVPAVGLDIPVTWLTKSTAMATGKRILTAIKRAWPAPPWSQAWSLTTAPRQNDQGRWWVPVAVSVPAKRAHVDAARKLAELLGVPGG